MPGVLQVMYSRPHPRALLGGSLDRPKPGEKLNGNRLRLAGWVIGREEVVVAVELLHESHLVAHVPLGIERPDLAIAFPEQQEAGSAGFRTVVPVLPGERELHLDVVAVFDDQRRINLVEVIVPARSAPGCPMVSVVIPCFNQAHLLSEALDSVVDQTYPILDVVVVDDGSHDNTTPVSRRYPGVRTIRHDNCGLAMTRNAGLDAGTGDYLMFLDADDRLLPHAIQTQLDAFSASPECAAVVGYYECIGIDNSSLPTPPRPESGPDPYAALLRANFTGMPATVMYRRGIFESIGGFEPSVNAAADYELFLRLSRDHPIHVHGKVVAEYRRHAANMSGDPALMLKQVLTVLRAQQPYVKRSEERQRAFDEGMHNWRQLYGVPLEARARRAWDEGRPLAALRDLTTLARHDPEGLRSAVASLDDEAVNPREVRLGDLRRLTPISRAFGYDRGEPIDRYYIEQFLAREAAQIKGRVLEVGDDAYTRQFGAEQVISSDVLHVHDGNSQATIVADLTAADGIASERFDCIILTETLQLIYDLQAAVRTLYRILAPGGVLLATVPGVSSVAADEWGARWEWSLTTHSARRLLKEAFPPDHVTVESHGNVLVAAAFLYGLASSDLTRRELDYCDPAYPLVITAWARKAKRAA